MMPETFEIARRFAVAGVTYWLIGGNGVELVVGRDLRDHDDIDFMVADRDAARAVQTLESLGFAQVHGSLEDGDVFYRRGELLVDLVPVQTLARAPRTLGALGAVRWPEGLLAPYLVPYEGGCISTLTPQMHLQMKKVVADFFGVALREKDLLDIRALQACTRKGVMVAEGAW